MKRSRHLPSHLIMRCPLAKPLNFREDVSAIWAVMQIYFCCNVGTFWIFDQIFTRLPPYGTPCLRMCNSRTGLATSKSSIKLYSSTRNFLFIVHIIILLLNNFHFKEPYGPWRNPLHSLVTWDIEESRCRLHSDGFSFLCSVSLLHSLISSEFWWYYYIWSWIHRGYLQMTTSPWANLMYHYAIYWHTSKGYIPISSKGLDPCSLTSHLFSSKQKLWSASLFMWASVFTVPRFVLQDFNKWQLKGWSQKKKWNLWHKEEFNPRASGTLHGLLLACSGVRFTHVGCCTSLGVLADNSPSFASFQKRCSQKYVLLLCLHPFW